MLKVLWRLPLSCLSFKSQLSSWASSPTSPSLALGDLGMPQCLASSARASLTAPAAFRWEDERFIVTRGWGSTPSWGPPQGPQAPPSLLCCLFCIFLPCGSAGPGGLGPNVIQILAQSRPGNRAPSTHGEQTPRPSHSHLLAEVQLRTLRCFIAKTSLAALNKDSLKQPGSPTTGDRLRKSGPFSLEGTLVIHLKMRLMNVKYMGESLL